MTELNKIASNIKDLLLCTNNQNLYRNNKKNKERLIKCDNPKIKVEYEKQNIDKNTFLLIFPRIVINPKSDNKNNLNITECITKGIKSIVFFLDFELKIIQLIVKLNNQ